MKNKNFDRHPKKTNGKKGIEVKHQKTPNIPLEPEDDKLWDEQHDHTTVLKGKTKNIKTAAKQRIKRQKTPNKLTSKTPLEPASSSTVNKNVLPEDDELWDEIVSETSASFMLKKLQLPPDYDFHDHNICTAEELGLKYGVPIPACYSKYFDEEAMVPVKPSRPSDLESYTLYPFSWNPFESKLSEDDSPSPPSDRDIMDLESNDAPIDLGGPMTRSKKKKVDAAFYEQMLAFESNPCENSKQWLKKLDDLGL
ncbi:hypothetical protein P8452_43800 [Trifolium repens]|nr:hypothetical protein P8452_43800 [Trifolium repens]